MTMKTLYVSDLDGTLLRGDQRLSDFTCRTVNDLVDRGMLFSYATARSFVTASKATVGLSPRVPVIIYNGSFVLESGTQRKLLSNAFAPADARRILDRLIAHGVYPIVYSYIDGVEKYSYVPRLQSRGVRQFQDTRRGDIRARTVEETDALYDGEIFYFTCIDEPDKLWPLHEALKEEFQLLYHDDIYSGERWLEIFPKGVSKANAVTALRDYLGCDRVVCFGDAVNDLSMFAVADECYAVGNAHPSLKAVATGVIGTNEEDGVARWLAEHFEG